MKFGVLNISLLLILIVSWCSKCEMVEFFDGEMEEFNDFVQGGLLNQIADGITPMISEDSGNALNCVQDLLSWSEDLRSLKTWAFKMLDAGGRPPHGLLEGNINSVGMFEECLGISYQKNQTSRTIKGKYCMARIPLPLSLITGRENMFKSMSHGFLGENQRVMNTGPKGLYFNIAVCLPASCKASFVDIALKTALAASNISLTVDISGDYCYVDEPGPWDAGEIAAVAVIAVVVWIVILGTLYDVWYKKVKKGDPKEQNFTLTAFSMYTNSLRLTTLSKDPGPLACIHGIRVISICWIILGHRYSGSGSFPVENQRDFFEWRSSYAGMNIVASTVTVDTFFLLSGLLLSYIFFRRTDNKSIRDIPMMYLHRFLRLTPILIMVMLIEIGVFSKLGRGPFWNQLNDIADDCKEYWWSMILYVQNYVNPDNMCVANTWYLSVDMQLYILSPLLLFPILKNVRIGLAWGYAWLLAALVTVFTISYLEGWMAESYADPKIRDRQRYSYFPTHMRASPWLIGILAGYYLRFYNNKKIKMNKIVVCILWLASMAIMSAVLYGLKPLAGLKHEFSYLGDTTYLAFSRPAWAMAVLWVIVACTFGYGGPVNWFLSLRLFEFLARLSYSMYLIHGTIVSYTITRGKTVPYFSSVTWVHLSFGDLLVTIIASYFTVLAFESPVTVLEKAIFGTEKKKPVNQPGHLVLDVGQMKRSEDEPQVVIHTE